MVFIEKRKKREKREKREKRIIHKPEFDLVLAPNSLDEIKLI